MKWIFLFLGFMFEILFLYSLMIKPVICFKKWQSGVLYGIPMVLYMTLFFLILNVEYQTFKINIEASNSMIVSNTVSVLPSTSTPTTSSDKNSNDTSKGDIIGDTDSKIYHIPGDPDYEKEMKKTSNNEYFKTTSEAEAAGYRASKKTPK